MSNVDGVATGHLQATNGHEFAASSIDRVAFVMVHVSPLIELGGADAGGMTVYVRALAEQLAELGIHVDIFTRRADTVTPDVTELADQV
ncbi:MAG: glycosyltransferase, partial [Chloroflexota bacterium]